MKHLTILNSKKEIVKISFLIHYTVDEIFKNKETLFVLLSKNTKNVNLDFSDIKDDKKYNKKIAQISIYSLIIFL